MAVMPNQLSGPLQAWRFNPTDDDQRELHQFSPNVPVSIPELAELGVLYWNIDVSVPDFMDKVEVVCAERKYKNRDQIRIHKDTLPNYDEKLKIFFEEHIHEDEEIRFILEGSGYFDVRDADDQWVRIAAKPSDMIILPAGMYHRFTLDTANYIKTLRLFKDDPVWTPLNRSTLSTDANKFRLNYVEQFLRLHPQLTGPVSAWKFNPTDDDQRELHQFNPNQPVTLDELADLGVLYWHIDINDPKYMEKVEKLAKDRGYKNRDTVNIRRETLPNYDEKIKTFFEEHIHEDEEIRFILEGSGYFDVRDSKDEWIRIATSASDLIILPAGLYHRFTLDTKNSLKALRLFRDDPKWTPLNRNITSTDSNKHRLAYLSQFQK
ncbi:hypothetical protein HDU84_000499 [Entophlyctis sp. JEL0112]|nr:hypothetical protein HDU84_000499 [Entophlyctis sp. JEL0112]